MKVLMLVDTHYQGPKFKGEECDVENVVARRWIERGIAEPLEMKEVPVTPTEPEADVIDESVDPEVDEEQDEEGEEEDLMKLSSKKLYALCKEKGLEVEPKQSKEYYVEMLTSEK